MFDVKAARRRCNDHPSTDRDQMLRTACDRIEALERENAAMAKLVSDADLPGLERDHNADLHEMVRIRAENDKFRKALTAIGKCSLDYCKIKQCDGPCAHKDARAALAPATSKEPT